MLREMAMDNRRSGKDPDSVAGRAYESPVLLELVGMVGAGQDRVLDIGTGTGANLGALAAAGHQVTGLTISQSEATVCRAEGFDVVVADAETPPLPFASGSFDVIFMSHVLEHLRDPVTLLRALPPLLSEGGSIYVALPNAVYYKQRLDFARGRFRYSETGIMDRTHLRFFDLESAKDLIVSAGFQIDEERVVGGVPSLGLRSRAQAIWSKLDDFGLSRFPGLFAFHLMFKASPASQ